MATLQEFMKGPALKGPLNRYRMLAPTASVRVSPLVLGTMTFGEQWSGFMGSCDKKASFDILDCYYDQGGNFIDTSNNYQNEESEKWIGEWMTQRGNRDELVLATKYTSCYRTEHSGEEIITNYVGNGAKSLKHSLEASLKKLQTSYIDLFYVHWWDYATSIPEVMHALHAQVLAGKVLYLGVSDTPAWVVSKANEYARQQGLTPFSVYQGRWGCDCRDVERDILPMAQAEGMALAPWGALGRGHLRTAAARAQGEQSSRALGGPGPVIESLQPVIEKLATAKGVGMTAIALAYVLSKAPYVFPIVGGRTVDHLKSNVEALTISLSDAEIKEIEGAYSFDIGFPQNMFTAKKEENFRFRQAGVCDFVEDLKPIKPASE